MSITLRPLSGFRLTLLVLSLIHILELGKAGRSGIGRLAMETEDIGREQGLKAFSADLAASGSNPSRRRHSRSRGPSVRTGPLAHESLGPAGEHAQLHPPSVQEGGGNRLRVSSLGLSLIHI